MVLTIVLTAAGDLPAGDLNGKSDPYVVFKNGTLVSSKRGGEAFKKDKRTRKAKSSVKHKTLNPEWNDEKISLPLEAVLRERHNAVVRLKCMDQDFMAKDDKLGSGFLYLREVPANGTLKEFEVRLAGGLVGTHQATVSIRAGFDVARASAATIETLPESPQPRNSKSRSRSRSRSRSPSRSPSPSALPFATPDYALPPNTADLAGSSGGQSRSRSSSNSLEPSAPPDTPKYAAPPVNGHYGIATTAQLASNQGATPVSQYAPPGQYAPPPATNPAAGGTQYAPPSSAYAPPATNPAAGSAVNHYATANQLQQGYLPPAYNPSASAQYDAPRGAQAISSAASMQKVIASPPGSMQIHLHVPASGTWTAGDLVRGTVEYNRHGGNKIWIKVVQLTLWVQASLRDGKKQSVYTAFRQRFVLFGGEHLKTYNLASGHHAYPFNIQFPADDIPVIGQAIKQKGAVGKVERVQVGLKAAIILPQGTPKTCQLLLDRK